MNRTVYIVNADHVSSKYRAINLRVTVSQYADAPGNPVLYFADAPLYGCGKNATTPERAIYSLLGDNGCTNIQCKKEGE
jgi:hypothetical protein